jgi:streptogramin lyase
VEGYDLRQLLAREGSLEPSRALGLLDQVADALDAAHERGLIHRDVKPANILIAERARREHCYLSDFGLTKQSASISGLTGTGELVGTVAYVSPEQIRGESVDARADVYALGCVLHECLTGEQPFARESDVATLWAHVHEPPPALAASRPELGGEIDRVLARALAKAPAERQQSCGELIASARAALGVHGTSSPASPRPRHSPRLGRLRAFLAAGAAVVLAAAVALAVSLRGDDGLTRIGPMSVGVIDPATNELVADIPLGFTSSLMAAGAGSIWVVDPEGNTLTRIDPKTMEIVAPPRGIPGSGGIPVGLAVGEGSVWVAVNQEDTLVVLEIGPALGDLRQTITLHEARVGSLSVERETVVLAIGEGSVWALQRARGEVTRIDPATNVPAPPPIAEGLDAIALAVGAGSVWLGGRAGVTRLDPGTGTKLEAALVPNVTDSQVTSIAVGPAAVWFAGSSQPRLWRLTPEGAILDSYPVGAGPSALAVSEDGIVWLANSTGGSVSRLDPETESVETIELGGSPSAIIAAYGAVWTSPGEPVR